MSILSSSKSKSIIVFSVLLILALLLAPVGGSAQAAELTGTGGQDTIQVMIDRGYIQTKQVGDIEATQNITRAEFMAVLERAFPHLDPFELAGAESMAWFAEALVAWNSDNATVNGAEKPVTNQEAAVIFSHLKKLLNDEAAAARFLDLNTASPWAQGPIGAVYKAGIMAGYGDDTFRPDRFVTWGEAMDALTAALDYTPVVTQPLTAANGFDRKALNIKDVEALGQSIVVFHSQVAGADVYWNGEKLEGVQTIQGTNAINVPAITGGEANTLSIHKLGYTRFTDRDVIWGVSTPQVENGDFETGDLQGWQVVQGGPFPQVQSSTRSEGVYGAYMGDGASGLWYGGGRAAISQTVSIVDESRDPQLNLDYLVSGSDWGYDYMQIYVDGSQVGYMSGTSGGWQNFQYDLSAYAGQDVQLTIQAITRDSIITVNYFVDNVRIAYDGGADQILTPADVTATPVSAGQTLMNSLLSGSFLNGMGDAVWGDLEWLNPDEIVSGDTPYYVYIFSPYENGVYLPVADTVKVDVVNDGHGGDNRGSSRPERIRSMSSVTTYGS